MKSQIQSQIFVYILGAIIMSLVLLFGYRSIRGMIGRGEQTSLLKFKSELKSTIATVSQDYGSIKLAEFEIPSGYRAVCFVNLTYDRNHLLDKIDGNHYPYIRDVVMDILDNSNAHKQNVFLMPPGTESDYVGNISVNTGFHCFNASQKKIKIKIEGFGNRAILSEP
ncbi:MAG: hypothetical protein ABIG95_01305 [Candidatus Woesearchaeota archaeon]